MKRRDFVELFACASAGFAVSRGRADVAGKTAITLLNPDCTGGGAGLCAVLRTPSGKMPSSIFDRISAMIWAYSGVADDSSSSTDSIWQAPSKFIDYNP